MVSKGSRVNFVETKEKKDVSNSKRKLKKVTLEAGF